MRKILSAMILILIFSSVSYAAVSEDIYVRKDVFDAEMRNINTKLDNILEELKSQRRELNEVKQGQIELTKTVAVLSERVDRNFETLSSRMDAMEKATSEKFEAIEKSFSAKISSIEKNFLEKISSLEKSFTEKISSVEKSFSEKISSVEKNFSGRIDDLQHTMAVQYRSLDDRINDLRNGLYLWLVVIGLILGYEPAKKFFQHLQERKAKQSAPSITIEDVKRLIAEAQLNTKS
ncbi:MAG: hypothetical protein IJP69_11360 [Synergistaceae bacterium]|nr:hypothetical protein [Synergistaceae bacterium]